MSAFISTPVLPVTASRSKSVCSRMPPRAQASSEGTPTSGDFLPEGMQQIEFVIRPNGIVEEHIQGVKGNECVKITKKLEEALGSVVDSEKTSDYYEQPVKVNEQVTDGNTTWNGSEWNWVSAPADRNM